MRRQQPQCTGPKRPGDLTAAWRPPHGSQDSMHSRFPHALFQSRGVFTLSRGQQCPLPSLDTRQLRTPATCSRTPSPASQRKRCPAPHARPGPAPALCPLSLAPRRGPCVGHFLSLHCPHTQFPPFRTPTGNQADHRRRRVRGVYRHLLARRAPRSPPRRPGPQRAHCARRRVLEARARLRFSPPCRGRAAG